ncbi:c-type cytochrome [Ramlibacter sp. AN1015]|uniref:c-type cytochrome n=1 Tax=Ramlibacter sp. AN1015 TaxID=3133428 RepID=UPI0030BA55D3
MTTVRVRNLLIGLLVLLLLGGVGAWLFVYFGIYNVAATRQHIPPVYRLLNYAMERSVIAESQDVRAPPDLIEPQRIRAGAVHYRAHCLQCHGAPGVAPDSLAYGMTPAPVNLMPAARSWPSERIFWIVKHGIKMSGMPAWEYRLSDDQIWDVVAFTKGMAAMSPREYGQLVLELPGGKADAGSGGKRPPDDATARKAEPPATLMVANAARKAPPGVATGPGVPLGNARVGQHKAQAFLCQTCHQIPGVVGANHYVGPPLAGIGTRTFIAGVVANDPQSMVRFLLDPQEIDPLSAMPPMGMSEQDARDIAAFLYTLRTP